MARGGGLSFPMPTHMGAGHTFSQVPRAQIERSTFDRSHGLKSTFNAGLLIPVYCDEALPGDTFTLHMQALARLTTPIKPLMDNMYLDSFFFCVPVRLLWTDWQKFNGEQTNPGDSTAFLVPQFTAYTPASGSISDYMGIPVAPQITAAFAHNSLHFRAYNQIYNQWFRDENLINSLQVDTGDGPDNIANYALQRRGKRHDYFTSCLPWPQKGTAVALPLGSGAPVLATSSGSMVSGHDAPTFWNQTTGTNAGALNRVSAAANSAVDISATSPSGPANEPLGWNTTSLWANLSGATAATINQLRQAFQIQKLLERDARGGSRYTEIIRSHFGVVSPDARMQRPEYLGGGSTPIMVSPIAQTGPTVTGQTAQANLSGVGVAMVRGHGFTKSFTEHCVLLGLVCVRADLTYQNGLEKMWQRQTRFDFYWPALAHIGEQSVLNYEVYMIGGTGAGLQDYNVFGYQERYAEYRYKPSRVTGLFRSYVTGALDYWHLAQNFTALPTLNQTFIEENPPISRVVAVTTEPQFYFDAFFSLKCARPMPVFGVPGFIDHF